MLFYHVSDIYISFNLQDHSLYRRCRWNIIPSSSSGKSLHHIIKAAQDLCKIVGHMFPGFLPNPLRVVQRWRDIKYEEFIDTRDRNNPKNKTCRNQSSPRCDSLKLLVHLPNILSTAANLHNTIMDVPELRCCLQSTSEYKWILTTILSPPNRLYTITYSVFSCPDFLWQATSN